METENITITAKITVAAKNMTVEECLKRATEEDANGRVEEQNAEDARLRAMIYFRTSGEWVRVAKGKAEAEGKAWDPVLKEYSKATGESVTTLRENKRIAENWERVEEDGKRRSVVPPIPTTKQAFWKRLKEIDGQRGDSDRSEQQERERQERERQERERQERERQERERQERERQERERQEQQDQDQGQEDGYTPFQRILWFWQQIVNNLPNATKEERVTFADGAQEILKSYTINPSLEAATRLDMLLKEMWQRANNLLERKKEN